MKRNLRTLFLLIATGMHGYVFTQNIDSLFYFNFQNTQISIEEALSKYIQFESISGSEREAGEYIKKLCEENGLFITLMGDTDGNYNIAASIYPLSKNVSNIIFLNHIDVVSPNDYKKWSHHPFSGDITEDEIWGRGSFDNKGAAIMQLASVIEIARSYTNINTKYNVTFLAVSCEETQCEGGIKYVVENYFEELNPAVIIGEGPPSLSNVLQSEPNATIYGISVAHKRALWLKLESSVLTSGHGSITPLSYANKELVTALNSIVGVKQKAIFNKLNTELLKDLGHLEKGMISFIFKHPRLFKCLIVPQLRKQPKLFSLFSNTITLTSINGNSAEINSIPSSANAILDCRLLPKESKAEFLAKLRRKINNDSLIVSVMYEMPEFNASDEKSIFYTNLNKAISSNYPDSYVLKMFSPNFNDTGIFRAKGVAAFSTIPVNMDLKYLRTVHNYNERIPREILNQGRSVYTEFLNSCLE